jgi:hypothetical protein
VYRGKIYGGLGTPCPGLLVFAEGACPAEAPFTSMIINSEYICRSKSEGTKFYINIYITWWLLLMVFFKRMKY